ncbi:hypothetical protein C5S53_02205 [Methanophagales archaeon]|nr:hypothetical protein C5S53_02205 [Methanophagales archaeon]
MTEKKTAKDQKKITVNLRGEVLMQAIELRQKREREAGVVVSVTEVIRDAIKEMYDREIRKVDRTDE